MGRIKRRNFYELVEENKKIISSDRYALAEIELKIEKKNEKIMKELRKKLKESVQ
ncbi:FbpB family small basic protein [Bacillus sp. EAC]|uniref:FbpB family small basic protein n=1 Tax=Bacillus sp. EAC TaxID=1978338 RepID=UPI000B450DCF|nr:FbpB family small basic protein [Bacillus sp. EAC]